MSYLRTAMKLMHCHLSYTAEIEHALRGAGDHPLQPVWLCFPRHFYSAPHLTLSLNFARRSPQVLRRAAHLLLNSHSCTVSRFVSLRRPLVRCSISQAQQRLNSTIKTMEPIAISSATLPSTSLPEPLRALLNLRLKADSALSAPALESELSSGTTDGPATLHVRQALEAVVQKARVWESECTSKLTGEEVARGAYILGWALGRLAEFDGTEASDMPGRLREALEYYEHAGRGLNLPDPPRLEEAPSVTRPKEGLAPLVLPEVAGWVGEMLAEWARAQTTLAFSSLLLLNSDGGDRVIDEHELEALLTIACRRNVQGEPF